jgi:membrane protein implicated in regulation of membrane protease activity
LPFGFLWQTFFVVFALTGLIINTPFIGEKVPLYTLAWTLPGSLLVSLVSLRIATKLLGPIFSSKDQEATRSSQLLGQEGVVISSRVTAEFGEIRLQDRSGLTLRLPCRLAKGSPEVHEGKSVVVVGQEGAYLKVVALELEPSQQKNASKQPEKA